MNTRRAEVDIEYQGVNITADIAPYFTGMTYDDNGNGRADDLRIHLEDREGRWRDPWMPERGDRIKTKIILRNWYFGNDRSFPCGIFEVDTVSLSGPPDDITIQASSLPGTSALKNEKRTESWEEVTLFQIASRMASNAGMEVMFETDDIRYDRLDQTEQTDLSFLSRTCEKEGISLKVTDNTIVLFDDARYENMPPIRTITRGESDILSYQFDLDTIKFAYAAAELNYFDSANNRNITGTFRLPDTDGPTLKLNERVAFEAEAIRKARNALRNANMEAQKARLTMVGDYALAQGLTVELTGFGKFSDKYIIESARHEVGGTGYRTTIELRKVLAY